MSHESGVLSELQLLTSMYDPSQVHFDDLEVVLRIENGLPISGSVSLNVKLNPFLQLSLRLPEGYPDSERLSASCQVTKGLTGSIPGQPSSEKVQGQLNHDLCTWLKSGSGSGESSSDERNVLGVISWLNERWNDLCKEEVEELTLQNEEAPTSSTKFCDKDKQCRIWIHSHHIYNEKKRKFIIDTANSLDLKGFSLPGKPGIICIQGVAENCDDFWTRTRQLSWQKISLIEREILEEEPETFSNFEELRLDMSSFMKYLEDKGVSAVVKGYFGFG